MDLPLRRRDPPVLVRVGVADHDFLRGVLEVEKPAIGGHVEQRAQRRCDRAQVLDSLEQGHETESRHAGGNIDKPDFPCEDHGG